MQITQAKILRLVDDNRIGIRYVNATLYNSGCQQHVIVIVHKVENNLFQLFRLHLSMANAYTAIGYVPLDHGFQLYQILYTVIDKEHLSVTAHFKINRFRYDIFIKGMHLCLNRITVGGWSLNDRKITGAHQRELQSTGNGSGGHGECVHIHFYLTQFLFHTDSELLFLINDQQS